MSMSVCVSAYVCPRAYSRNRTSNFHQFLCNMLPTAVTRDSTGGLAAMHYTSGFMDDVMFAHNGQELATRKRRIFKVSRYGAAHI